MPNRAPFNQCVECDEIITNPICSECLAERMRLVVQEHDQHLSEDIVGTEIEGNTICLFCGKRMGLCPHCFSREIYGLIQERNPALTDEFVSCFDFDLRRDLLA